MPPKRKKQEDGKVVDALSYLDEVGSCLDRARNSSKACLNGIAKADLVLKECRGDTDILCIALVRRAELLLIAAQKNYNIGSLPGSQRQYSLNRCIDDCEKVLQEVSPDEPAGKQVYDTAKAVYNGAQRLLETQYTEKKGGKSNTKNKKTLKIAESNRYDPAKTCFKSVSKINLYLLQDIVNCYKQAKTVCRMCYYRQHAQEPFYPGRQCKGCRKLPQPLVMIPASVMCENFSGLKVVPIPQPPKALMEPSNKNKPFQICRNRDHRMCEGKASVGEHMYAHSIEELVVWTIQRHYGCRFQKYIDSYHRNSDPPDPSRFSTTTTREGDGWDEGSEDGDTDDLFSESYSEHTYDTDEESYEYYPDKLLFREVSAIPQNLLLIVVEKYRSMKEYCKSCFYKSSREGIMVVDRQQTNFYVCSICNINWVSVKVIPASDLCWNFGDFDLLPIAPWPRGKPNKDPFEYCKKKDHHRCFRVYFESEFWYPHSVEEMVIWTVEREKKCVFSSFISSICGISPEITPRNHSSIQGPPSHPAQMNSGSRPPPTNPVPPPAATAAQQVGVPSQYNTATPEVRNQFTQPHNNSNNPPVLPGNRSYAEFMHPPGVNYPFNAVPPNGRNPNGAPMMYLSQQPPMFQHRRPPLLFPQRLPVRMQQGPYMNHQNVGQPMGPPPFPGATNPPRVFTTMTPHTLYNPYLMNPMFSTSSVPSLAPPGMAASEADNISSGKENQSEKALLQDNKDKQLNVSDSLKLNPRPNTAADVASMNSSSSSSENTSKLYGRKNYKVAPSSSGTVSSTSPMVEVQTSSSTPILATRVKEDVSPQIFKFSETKFTCFLDIPTSLLKSIAVCFKDKSTVCRKCFYGERCLSGKSDESGEVCSFGNHEWNKPIVVIPGSSLCDNEPSFQKGEHVPIPPLPPVAVLRKCSNHNHHKCFTKSLEQDLWQAHSIEELVVWITESEKDCSFEEFIKKLQHEDLYADMKSPLSPVSVSDVEEEVGFSTDAHSTSPLIVTSSEASPRSSETPVLSTVPDRNTKFSAKKYNPRAVSFVVIDDIPPELLSSVAESFKRVQLVCRICFFESKCKALVYRKGKKCENKEHSPWKAIKVIPSSPMCSSLSEYIPIPPLPKHMKHSDTPFMACKKHDHKTCFNMSRGTNPWFPHSVEELVIWTVERACDQPFENVYKRYLPHSEKPAKKLKSPSPVKEVSKTTKMVSELKIDTSKPINYSDAVTNSPTKAVKPNQSPAPRASNPTATFKPHDQGFVEIPGHTNETKFSQVDPLSYHSGYVPSQFYPQYVPQAHFDNLFQPANGGITINTPNGNAMGLGFSGVTAGVPPGIEERYGMPVVTAPGLPFSAQVKSDDSKFNGSNDAWNQQFGSGGWNVEQQAPWKAVGSKEPYSDSDHYSLPDDFVHQSQVDNDRFQPYDFKEPPVMPAISKTMSGNHQDDQLTAQVKIDATGGKKKRKKKPGAKAVNQQSTAAAAANAYESAGVVETGISKRSDGSGSREEFQWSSINNGNDQSIFALSNEQSSGYGGNKKNMDSMVDSTAPQKEVKVDTRVSNPAPRGTGSRPPLLPTPEYDNLDGLTRKIHEKCCLLCYGLYQSLKELTDHCSSVDHLEMAVWDSGAEKLWQYPPPPPQKPASSSIPAICVRSQCEGPPYCRSPHSEMELGEWMERWRHRDQRKKNGLTKSSNNIDTGRKLPISACNVLQANVAEPYVANNCYCWDLTISGENWLNVFGVKVTSSSSWSFRITRIVGNTTSSVFQPHSTNWTVPSLHKHLVRQCLLLGSMELTIKAAPPSNGRSSNLSGGQLILDLGYKETISIELKAPETDGANEIGGSGKRFVPQHQWNLSESSDSSDDWRSLNIEGEDLTLQHVPIEDWGCSLTDDQPRVSDPWNFN